MWQSQVSAEYADTLATGLCERRKWMKPQYGFYYTSSGVTCVVLVNEREYVSEAAHASKDLAAEDAATQAYCICRNYSVNNGIGRGQGRPFQRSVAHRPEARVRGGGNDVHRRGGSSPTGSDSSRPSSSGSSSHAGICRCEQPLPERYSNCPTCYQPLCWA